MNIDSNLISVARSWKPKILRSDHANRAVGLAASSFLGSARRGSVWRWYS